MSLFPAVFSRACGRPALSLACATCLWGAATAGFGQQPAEPARTPTLDIARTNVRVFTLRHTKADEFYGIVQGMLGQGRGSASAVMPDTRTNSLVVRATPDLLEMVANLIAALDVPAAEQPAGVSLAVRVFQVANVVLDRALERQLQVALSDRGRMAVDAERNAVVVHDTPEALAAFDALLTTLDRPSVIPKPSPAGLRLRVVWLVSGMERHDAPPPPVDLKGVVADLARISAGNLQLAAQTTVQAVANNEFLVACTPELDGPCELTISGSFGPPPMEQNALRLKVSAFERVGGGQRSLCDLSTTIFAPPGRTIVLGAAPVGKMTSVFVVQVTQD